MKNSRKRLAAVLVSIVAVIAIVSGSLAWYTSTNSLQQSGKLFGFKTEASVYFKLSDGTTATMKPDENGMYKLSLDSNAKNYVGNLRVNVIQRGRAKSYTRVKMNVEWVMPDGTVTQNIMLPFKFADKWFDNRSEDYCVYYTESSGLGQEYDKSIITGFDEGSFIDGSLTQSATPQIAISVESVQVNRYQQFWGIDELPWK